MSTCAQDNYVDMQYTNSIDIGKFTDKRPTNTRLNATYMYIINMFLFNNTVYTDLKRETLSNSKLHQKSKSFSKYR